MEKQKPTEKTTKEKEDIFSWKAIEYIQHQRDARWYLIAGIILAFIIIISIITYNWSLAVAVVVLAGVYEYTYRQHPPKRVLIRITDLGIHVGHMFFQYSHIQAFWIYLNHGNKTLNFRVYKRIHSDVIVQLDDQDPAAIREYLVGQIPEWEGKNERATDVLLRLLKL